MALAFGASVLDGKHTKICTVTCLDSDVNTNLAVDFTTNGMTDLDAAPIEYRVVKTAHAADNVPTSFAITAVAATGFTIACLEGGGGGAAITLRVILRYIHSIDR